MSWCLKNCATIFYYSLEIIFSTGSHFNKNNLPLIHLINSYRHSCTVGFQLKKPLMQRHAPGAVTYYR